MIKPFIYYHISRKHFNQLLTRNRYSGFTKYANLQILKSKVDKSLLRYYASDIPHLIIEIKVPIRDIKLIDSNLIH